MVNGTTASRPWTAGRSTAPGSSRRPASAVPTSASNEPPRHFLRSWEPFRSSGDPVLYLSNPPGISPTTRRRMLDGVAKLNRLLVEKYGDPEIETRVSQYEMAYRMQTSVPDLMDLSKEPESTFELYGPDSRKPGTFAANCLLARRLSERGVRFVQVYYGNGQPWDTHSNHDATTRKLAADIDRPIAA